MLVRWYATMVVLYCMKVPPVGANVQLTGRETGCVTTQLDSIRDSLPDQTSVLVDSPSRIGVLRSVDV